MRAKRILRELELFDINGRCFSESEALDVVPPTVERSALMEVVRSSRRLLDLGLDPTSGERYFVFKSTLFNLLIGLNIRLARSHCFGLSPRQFVTAFNTLRSAGRWDRLPGAVARFGGRFGLVREVPHASVFGFPWARLLSHIDRKQLWTTALWFQDFVRDGVSKRRLKDLTDQYLSCGWSQFNFRLVDIVQRRAGLKGRSFSLHDLGTRYKLTRERIRQLELNFWKELKGAGNFRRRPFLSALLCDVLCNAGSLLIQRNSKRGRLVPFMAKCAGIPCDFLKELGLVLLGAVAGELGPVLSRKNFQEGIEESQILIRLKSTGVIYLAARDEKLLVRCLMERHRRKLSKTQRIFLALQKIGRPAHYSEITEIHNHIFPDRSCDDRSIHSALSMGKHDIVWIGIKGTFALKEWGYERPSKRLFDAVAEIVERVYRVTNRPVAWNAIAAEIANYRRVINRTSLIFAVHLNPRIQRAGDGLFLPSDSEDQNEDGCDARRLDMILKEFDEKKQQI